MLKPKIGTLSSLKMLKKWNLPWTLCAKLYYIALRTYFPVSLAASIHCTSSSKHPPDALLKVTAQHRRVRSPAWSYRFPVNEEWCELVVSLPSAILLHEVHIQPHSSGLSSKCLRVSICLCFPE